jgi:hypothetical protein
VLTRTAHRSDWARFAEEEYGQMAMEHAAEEEEADEVEAGSDADAEGDISLMDLGDNVRMALGARGSAVLDDTPAVRRAGRA